MGAQARHGNQRFPLLVNFISCHRGMRSLAAYAVFSTVIPSIASLGTRYRPSGELGAPGSRTSKPSRSRSPEPGGIIWTPPAEVPEVPASRWEEFVTTQKKDVGEDICQEMKRQAESLKERANRNRNNSTPEMSSFIRHPTPVDFLKFRKIQEPKQKVLSTSEELLEVKKI